MDFLNLFPVKEVELNQFQTFYLRIASEVEKAISCKIKNESKLVEDFFPVLDALSWNEWLKKLPSFVKPLSILLTVLMYDRITYITRLLDHLPEIDEFLNRYRSSEQIFSLEARNDFIQNFDHLSKKAVLIESRASILEKNPFL